MIPCETCISFAICIHKNVASLDHEKFLRVGYMTGTCEVFKKWWYDNFCADSVIATCKLYNVKSAVG